MDKWERKGGGGELEKMRVGREGDKWVEGSRGGWESELWVSEWVSWCDPYFILSVGTIWFITATNVKRQNPFIVKLLYHSTGEVDPFPVYCDMESGGTHGNVSLFTLNIKFAKTWTQFSNNVNNTVRKYSSRAFIWVVTPADFAGHFRISVEVFLV